MALGGIVKKIHPAYLGLVTIFALVELIITAILVRSFNSNGYPAEGGKGTIRFLLFASIWTFLFSISYIVVFLIATSSIAASLISQFVFTVITFFFWLGGAAAITDDTTGGLQCGNYERGHCNQLNAALAFAWMEFILFALFGLLLIFLLVRSMRNGNGITGSMAA